MVGCRLAFRIPNFIVGDYARAADVVQTFSSESTHVSGACALAIGVSELSASAFERIRITLRR
jgi:hypothetical protein